MAFGAWTKHINTDCTDSRGHFIEWSELHVATFLILRCLHRFKTSWEIRWFLLNSFPLMGSLLAKKHWCCPLFVRPPGLLRSIWHLSKQTSTEALSAFDWLIADQIPRLMSPLSLLAGKFSGSRPLARTPVQLKKKSATTFQGWGGFHACLFGWGGVGMFGALFMIKANSCYILVFVGGYCHHLLSTVFYCPPGFEFLLKCVLDSVTRTCNNYEALIQEVVGSIPAVGSR